MKTLNPTSLTLMATLAILSGCGSSGVSESAPVEIPQEDGSGSTSGPTLTPGYAPYNYAFSMCGLQPKTVSGLVQTDNILNIRVKADPAPANSCYSSSTTLIPYAARYSCVRYKVTMQVKTGTDADKPVEHADTVWMNRTTMTTPPLAPAGTSGCEGSKTEVVYQLSNQLFPGHGLVRFQVEAVDTNHMCNYYRYCRENSRFLTQYDCRWAATMSEQSVCPLKPVYQYHSTAGQLDVQTDASIL